MQRWVVRHHHRGDTVSPGTSIASLSSPCVTGRRLRFLANVDPVDVKRALEGLDPEETLVVVVSKTFTTAETMLNARTLKDWLLTSLKGKAATEAITKSHIVAVSTSVDK